MIEIKVSKLELLQLENKSIKSLIIPIVEDDLIDYVAFYKNKKSRRFQRGLSIEDYISSYELPYPVGNEHVKFYNGKNVFFSEINIDYSFASDIHFQSKAMCGCMDNPNSGPYEQHQLIDRKFKKWFNDKFKKFKKVGLNYHNFSMTAHGVKPHHSGTSTTYINPICVVIQIL